MARLCCGTSGANASGYAETAGVERQGASLGRGPDLQPAGYWDRFFDEYQEAVNELFSLSAETKFWRQHQQQQQ